MSVPLGSLEDFLEEPLTQELPRSFMVRPAPSLNDESNAPSSRFANWRRGVATRFANIRQKMQENQQRKAANKTPELTAPLQSEVDALKSELEALRNEMRMMKGEFKSKKGSNGSSGDETIETATSDPIGSGVTASNQETTDSDDERLERSMTRLYTQAAFGDDRFSGWSSNGRESGGSVPSVQVVPAAPDSFDEGRHKSMELTPRAMEKVSIDEGRHVSFDEERHKSMELTPRGMDKVSSVASQEVFGDDRFNGW